MRNRSRASQQPNDARQPTALIRFTTTPAPQSTVYNTGVVAGVRR